MARTTITMMTREAARDVLGLNDDTITVKSVRTAYLSVVKQWHPDIVSKRSADPSDIEEANIEEANRRMAQATEARRVLLEMIRSGECLSPPSPPATTTPPSPVDTSTTTESTEATRTTSTPSEPPKREAATPKPKATTTSTASGSMPSGAQWAAATSARHDSEWGNWDYASTHANAACKEETPSMSSGFSWPDVLFKALGIQLLLAVFIPVLGPALALMFPEYTQGCVPFRIGYAIGILIVLALPLAAVVGITSIVAMPLLALYNFLSGIGDNSPTARRVLTVLLAIANILFLYNVIGPMVVG